MFKLVASAALAVASIGGGLDDCAGGGGSPTTVYERVQSRYARTVIVDGQPHDRCSAGPGRQIAASFEFPCYTYPHGSCVRLVQPEGGKAYYTRCP